MHELKIHPEFSQAIPPLSQGEYAALERDITSSGQCRDALIVWNGYIVDGHNRYAICRVHGIPFRVEGKAFPNKAACLAWIVNHQLGRRNLTDADRIELALRLNGNALYMRCNVAAAAKVSEQTVHRYMKVRELANPELLRQVKEGEMKINAAYRLLELEITTVTTLCEAEKEEEPPGYAALCRLLRFMKGHLGLWENNPGLAQVWEKLYGLRVSCNPVAGKN
jgi:hypothetical protein